MLARGRGLAASSSAIPSAVERFISRSPGSRSARASSSRRGIVSLTAGSAGQPSLRVSTPSRTKPPWQRLPWRGASSQGHCSASPASRARSSRGRGGRSVPWASPRAPACSRSPWGARVSSPPSRQRAPQSLSCRGAGQLRCSRSGRSRQSAARGSSATVPYPAAATSLARLARVSARPCHGSSRWLWGSTSRGASSQSAGACRPSPPLASPPPSGSAAVRFSSRPSTRRTSARRRGWPGPSSTRTPRSSSVTALRQPCDRGRRPGGR